MRHAVYRGPSNEASKKFRRLLVDADLTMSDAGRTIGVTQSAISHVIYGRHTSRRILRSLCELLASKLGRNVLDLFPDYAHLWSPWQERVR
jgi:transcriptional regulator with XRE-family HTH domain